MKLTKDLTEGNIYKNFILYTVPLILSALLSSLYSTVDAMIAGKLIGENALGAITATASYDFLFYAFFTGFGPGFAVYIAMLFGKKDHACLKRDTVHVLCILAVVVLCISGVSILLCDRILDLLRVDPILRADAKIYFVICAAGYVFTYLNLLLLQVLQSLGITRVSLYVSLGSATVNLIGNLLTVLVLKMGVAGLALSTVFSTLMATGIYLWMIRRAFRDLPTPGTSYRFSFSCLRRSLRYTLPAAIQQTAYHCVGFLIAPTVNGLGAAATTANTVANRIKNMVSLSFWNGTAALSCYTAQCMGAGKQERIRKGLWADFCLCVGLLLPFLFVFVTFARPITSLFFPMGYVGEAYQYALRFSTFYLLFIGINMLGHLIHAYLRGLGEMNVVFGLSVLGSLVNFIAVLSLVPQMGMEGVYLGLLLGWIADTVGSVLLYVLFFRTRAHIDRALRRTQGGGL